MRKSGSYPIKGKITINEIIASAGGPAGYANLDKIKLIRYVGNGKREIVNLSYNDLQQGRGDELLIQDKDVVFVESSTFKTIIMGMGFKIGLPGTGFSYTSPIK